jgi:hypothetical protein
MYECDVREAIGTIGLGKLYKHGGLTLIKRSACAEYARRTILGSEEERCRIDARIMESWFVVI